MSPEVLVSLIIAVLTIAGNILISYMSNRKTTQLTLYRLEQLEKKVDLHNSVVIRMYEAEKDIQILKETKQDK